MVKPAAPPKVTKGELANFAFAEVARQLRGRDQAAGLVARRGPGHRPAEDRRAAVLVEKADDGQMYFAIQDYPARPAAQMDQITAIPKHVVVFWDASGSRAGDHKREIAAAAGLS